MRTDIIENPWVFALLASKCKSLSWTNLIFLLFALILPSFIMSLTYWAHAGGPAWGKWRWTRGVNKPRTVVIPGPRGFPVVGSMSLMTGLAHRKIAAAAESCRARRLMAFSLGETRVIVTSNPDVAKEILNNLAFADRPVKESAYSLMFDRAIGFAPYGLYWRTLRRIAAVHLFCPKQIKASEAYRFDIANQMVNMIGKTKGGIVARDALKRASLNNMMWLVFGRKYSLDYSDFEIDQIRKLVDQGYQLLGTLNWSDHFSWLAHFDPQKIRFNCSELVPKVTGFIGPILAEHRERRADTNRDFVDVLLSLRGPDRLTDSDMIAVLWEMIFRGTDTVAVLTEWILARMVIHPQIQSTVQNELDRLVGKSRAVTEGDISAMLYLPAVVKEVLRLHPPGPLLSWARLAITDIMVDGCHVPAGTTAMVNMWAIMRDPEFWTDPLTFKPERFIVYDQQQPQLASAYDLSFGPFGSGRRSCPGKNLGLTTVTFWVASLLHEFEWGPCDHAPVDLSEVLTLSCGMAEPLTVNLRPRRASSSIQLDGE